MLLAVAAVLGAAAPSQLSCSFSGSHGAYACHRGGSVVMDGAPIACHVDGSWHVAGKGLQLQRSAPVHGTDEVGSFTGTKLTWSAGARGTAFTTAIRTYASPEAVVFEYGFPSGANGTSHLPTHDPVFPWKTAHSTIVNFPAMATVAPRRVLSWQDAFITPQVHTHPSLSDTLYIADVSYREGYSVQRAVCI